MKYKNFSLKSCRLVLLLIATAFPYFCSGRVVDVHSVDELNDFAFSGEGHTTSVMVLLGLYEPSCREGVDTMSFSGANRNAPEQYLKVVRIERSLFPDGEIKALWGNRVANSCFSALSFNARTAITNPSSVTYDSTEQGMAGWVSNQMRVDMVFVNEYDETVQVNWFEEGKEEVFNNLLAPGEMAGIGSFVGHLFTVRAKERGNLLLDYLVVDGPGKFFLHNNPGGGCTVNEEGFEICENMDSVLFEFAMDLWFNRRQELNYVQPNLVPGVTQAGFEKHRLPAATYERLKKFYNRNEPNKRLEGPVGPCLNQHIAPTYIINLSGQERTLLTQDIQPLLEDWADMYDLEMTSIYGIRQYTRGSVLRNHVDTVNTHVVSAIINVAQSPNATWDLEILDHDGHPHRVPMEAGDIVYYESARLLHGRETPLDGDYYANVFIHFKPRTGWDFDWV